MLNFAGSDLPSYVKVKNIKYSILPIIEAKTQKVYGRAGEYDFGTELGTKQIDVDIQIIGTDQYDIMKKAREFTTWLYHQDLQPLITDDEPDKKHMARVIGGSEVSELYRVGEATITFLCPSPFAESLTEKEVTASPTDLTPFTVENNGSAETYPVITLKMKDQATSISVISNDKFVQIGQDDTPTKTNTNANTVVLRDTFETYTGWTAASAVDGGVVTGDFASTGMSLKQANNNYGTAGASQYHGASAIKSLSKPVSSFTLQALVGISATNVKQVGRIEIYLLDANNLQIGKIAMVDRATNGEFNKAEARVGSLSGGVYVVNDYGSRKGVFANYEGILKIVKNGKKWTASFGKRDDKGKLNTRLTREFYDSENKYSDAPLAKVQIHIATIGANEPVLSMFFSDLKVTENNTVDSETETPILFEAEDEVIIDTQKAIVLKNGEPIFTELDPSSDFFSLDRGTNGLILSPPVADVTVRFTERWL